MCLCLGIGPVPRVSTKLLKILYHSDNVFGQYVDFESHNTRSSNELRHSRISPAEFGLCNKCKETNFPPMSENRISGNGNRFNQNDFVIETKEATKSCQDMTEPSQESFYNSSGIEQGCRSPIIHNASSGTSKDSVKISSTTTNCMSKEKMNYQSVITLSTKSRTKLTWWIENLRFYNDRTFSQLTPWVIIQTDASLAGWRAVCNRVQTSGQCSEE